MSSEKVAIFTTVLPLNNCSLLGFLHMFLPLCKQTTNKKAGKIFQKVKGTLLQCSTLKMEIQSIQKSSQV